MTDRRDVVVIGAGLGGLAAAAYLAKAGLRTTLLEQHNIPGGYATSFVRGRFEFEVALHQLSGITFNGEPGSLYRLLDRVGVAKRLRFHPIPTFYRSVFPGTDVRLPVGREASTDALCRAFPHEARGIREFVDLMFKIGAEVYTVVNASRKNGGSPTVGEALRFATKAPNLMRYSVASVADVLRRYVKDVRAQAVLVQTVGYYGMPPSQASFVLFAAGTALLMGDGPYYVEGRSQALSNAFVAAIEEMGGEVRFQSPVARVHLRGGRTSGVTLASGEEIPCDFVVSNASPLVTCRDLVGAAHIPAAYWNRLRSTTVGPSSINVFLGLARSAADLGIVDNDIFVNQDYDFEGQHEALRTLQTPRRAMVTCHNATYPAMSPPGTAIVTLTELSYAEPWYGLPAAQYVDTKNRIADGMLQLVEPVYPGLRDAIEVVEVATPITNMRYTGHPGGAIYGFDETPFETHVWRVPHAGPIPGLYFCGAWTPPCGGFETTLVSGQTAAALVAGAARQMKGGA